MSCTPAEIHACAVALNAGAGESEYRASVSRSYYAAYHAVRAWYTPLVPGANIGPPGGTHQQFVNCLRNPATENSESDRKKSKIIGAQVDVIRLARYKADYDLNAAMTKLEAENMVTLSSVLMQKAAESP